MDTEETEACGRCAMSSVVSVATSDEGNGEGEGEGERPSERGDDGRDPFADASIEVPEDDLRRASPGTYFAGLKRRLDDWATRLTYGR